MPVIVKRYQNRKLYNTQTKRYITLEGIERIIKDGYEVKIIDNQTREDITAITLSQVIFELEKNYSGFLPIKVLLTLIRSGGQRIDDIRRNLFASLNLSHHYDVEIEKRISILIERGEMTQEAGAQLLEKLLRINANHNDIRTEFEERIFEFIRERQIPTKKDFQLLVQKIDNLSQKVETYKLENSKTVK